jgi:hypothetical protein
MGISSEQLAGGIDSIKLTISGRRIVARDESPYFHEVEFGARTPVNCRH